MDDQHAAARGRSPLVRWLAARALILSASRAPLVARGGRWLLRAMRWQGPVRQAVAGGRTAMRRVRPAFRFAYYVLPAPLLRRRPRPPTSGPEGVAVRARIIANPASGGLHGDVGLDDLEDMAGWLTERGLPTELCLTERRGHARELARDAVKVGMETVIAAGGDGTVNEVVQALAGHTTALGVIPMGTVNVWAREMGIPLRPAQAREVLLSGVRRQVDLGRAGAHYFLLMAGVGFDAEVARRVDKSALKRWGLKFVDYMATAGVLSVMQQPAHIWMRCEGKRRSMPALMVLIGNTRLYGGAFSFATDAVADDGLLDVVIVGGEGLVGRLLVILRAALRRGSLGPRVRYERCRTIRLESSPPLPVQVDGEVIGTLPMTFSIAPHALRVIVPASAPSDLFERDPLAQ
jgi:YegS/Rv2252/BmrU family lipid kinase